MAGNIGDNVMRMQRARYRGFNALRGGSRFFVTESAAVSDRRHTRRNFQFPNLLQVSERQFNRRFLTIPHLNYLPSVFWSVGSLGRC